MKKPLAALLAAAVCVPALARAQEAPKPDPLPPVQREREPKPARTRLADGAQKTFSLDGIVDPGSDPFACRFGRFTVKLIGQDAEGRLAKISGGGILLNSGWLHLAVGSNPKITYVFPSGRPIADGAALSAYCNTGGSPGRAPIVFFVLGRRPKP